MGGKVYVGDQNTELRVDMKEDLTGYSYLKLKVKKPDNSEVEWAPVLVNNDAGLPTVLRYYMQPTDLDMRGIFKIQPHVGFAGGWVGRGETIILEVFGHYQ